MNIGIDGNEANIKNRVGVNVYAFKLLHELKIINEKRSKPNNLIVYLKEKPLYDLPKETKNFKYKIISGSGLWIITKLTPYLLKNPDHVDVLFSPSHYTCPILTIPRVCSIMDLGYLENSGQFEKKVFWQLKYWTAISVFISKGVLTISEASKKDIVRHYPQALKKITVTHLSHDLNKNDFKVSPKDVRRIRNRYSIVDDYILYLGTLKPSKNIEGIIKAYFQVISNNSNLNTKLVIAGKKGWLYEGLFKLVDELNIKDRVIFTDFIPEEDKMALRKGAKVFVLASFWEGFGIDALSSMAIGVPVIASNVGSLPEVLGDAALIVDPNNIDSIAESMEKVLNMDKNEYNYLIKKGLTQANKFSWEKCAKETLDVLEKVTN
ncbi:MAG: glycosyltransferase family 1 protein [bacterium]|nr:MAG: glycosyltransferase family 1 protein [bacterium]